MPELIICREHYMHDAGGSMIEISLHDDTEVDTSCSIEIFLSTHFEISLGHRHPFDKIYALYGRFAEMNGLPHMSAKTFSRRLTDMGFPTFKSDSATFKMNIKPTGQLHRVRWKILDD